MDGINLLLLYAIALVLDYCIVSIISDWQSITAIAY